MSANNKKVLIVDDSKVMQTIVHVYVKNPAIECSFADSAEEALEMLAAERFDLVVSDILMGEMSGIDLARHIRRRADCDSTSIVLITSRKDVDAYELVTGGLVDAFLNKPLDPQVFQRVVEQRLFGKRERAVRATSAAAPVTVAIADDSEVSRRILRQMIDGAEGFELVGVACDGEQAVEIAQRVRPQLMLLDVIMPGLDGFEATRRIMETAPTRIVLVTLSVPRDAARAFQATEVGALDILRKPRFDDIGAPAGDELVERLRMLAGVSVVRLTPPGRRREVTLPPPPLVPAALSVPTTIAICGSTGGPPALRRLLGDLRPGLHTMRIAIVQHIDREMVRFLADWLGEVTNVAVEVAVDGSQFPTGSVLLAPADAHLAFDARGSVRLCHGPPIGGFRPSGTVLFESVAEVFGGFGVGVILTGMGDDGVAGLGKIRAAGGWVIAQDLATSVVHGMPGAAIEQKVADVVAPLTLMAHQIFQRVGSPKK